MLAHLKSVTKPTDTFPQTSFRCYDYSIQALSMGLSILSVNDFLTGVLLRTPRFINPVGVTEDFRWEELAGSPEVIASLHWLESCSTGENLVLERSFSQDAVQPHHPLLLQPSELAQVEHPEHSLGNCSAGLHCRHPCIGWDEGDQKSEPC